MTHSRFAIAALALSVLAGCPKRVTEKDRIASDAHYNLALQAQHEGTIPTAMRELQEALELDPGNPDAHHLYGVLLHVSFKRYDEAEAELKRALELDPKMTMAMVNLGNLYLDRERYKEAIDLYTRALNDLRYETPYLAQTNRGWAYFKQGKVEEALSDLKSAATTNPKFCAAHRNLAEVYDSQGKTDQACVAYTGYREACPEMADAYFREGVCAAKRGRVDDAKAAFAACQAKGDGQLREDCRRLLEQLQ